VQGANPCHHTLTWVLITVKYIFMPEETFGMKAVGLSFNPSGDENVNKIKSLYAEIIDLCHALRADAAPGKARHLSAAITDAETAQMRAVKGITWQD
jgi:hypothetical protein